MLNKLKVILGFGVIMQVVRVFFPQFDVGDDFEPGVQALIEALYVVVPIILGWFVKESPATIAALAIK